MKEAGSPPPRTPLAGLDSHPEVASHKEETDGSHKRRGLMFWLLIALGAFIVLAVALGVGLGVGLTRHKSSTSSRWDSFRMDLGIIAHSCQVLHLQQKTLHRTPRYLMGFSTTHQCQLWRLGMGTSGCCSRKALAIFEKHSSHNQQIHGRAISTISSRLMQEIIHRWQHCL